MGSVICVIPARSGSKSIKDKNIVELCGKPLIAHSIETALEANNIDRVLVSTDSPDYRDISLSYGAEVPFIRPRHLALDTSTDLDFMGHLCAYLREQEECVPSIIVHLRPTTPLRDAKLVDSAIANFLCDSEATSLRSAHLAPESPLKWFKKGESCRYWKGFGDDEELVNESVANKPKQSFDPVYIPNGYVDIVRPEVVTSGRLHGEKILAFCTPPVVEIDSEFEYELLSSMSAYKDGHR